VRESEYRRLLLVDLAELFTSSQFGETANVEFLVVCGREHDINGFENLDSTGSLHIDSAKVKADISWFIWDMVNDLS
jgi:hypothetical protein